MRAPVWAKVLQPHRHNEVSEIDCPTNDPLFLECGNALWHAVPSNMLGRRIEAEAHLAEPPLAVAPLLRADQAQDDVSFLAGKRHRPHTGP
jgi:hypothetical protein